METVILDANKPENIELCAAVLKNGGAVAIATETVYGLGADALDKDAIDGIFAIKGRQRDNPLIVHVASVDDIKPLVSDIPSLFEPLANRFFPGPLTLIMKKSDAVPHNVTAGLDTVAVRMPEHPAALALIKAFGGPIAAPSANPSGRPSPTKAVHVLNDINGKIPYILDGGDCKVGIESTVLDISGNLPKVLRPGAVTYDNLREFFSDAGVAWSDDAGYDADIQETPMSPGMKYRHYSPKSPLTAVAGLPDDTAKYITAHMDNDSVALMFDDYYFSHPNVISFGHSRDFSAQAARLFDALREADGIGSSVIYAQVPQEDGLGLAVANRIKKAAGGNLVMLS